MPAVHRTLGSARRGRPQHPVAVVQGDGLAGRHAALGRLPPHRRALEDPGGGQERDRRSGTHNVAGIVGMAAAMRATVEGRARTVARVAALRDRLADGLLAAVPDAVETGRRAGRVAGSCHLRFPGAESEALLVLLDDAGVCASAGSACASGALEPSHVLAAMGVPRDEALASLRLSLGPATTDDEVDLALKTVPEAVARLREG